MSSGDSNNDINEVLSNLVDATKGIISASEQIATERSAALGERLDAIRSRTDNIPIKAMTAFDKAADAFNVLNDKAAEAIGYVKPTASTIILGSWTGALVQGVQTGVLGHTLSNLSRVSQRGMMLSELDKSPRLFLQVVRGVVKDPRFQHHSKVIYFAFAPSSQLKRTVLGLDDQGELAKEFASTLQVLNVPAAAAELPIRRRLVYGPNEEKQMLLDALQLRQVIEPETLLLFYFYGVGGEIVPFSHPQLVVPAELGNVALVGDTEGSTPSVRFPGAVRVEFSNALPRVLEIDGIQCTVIGYGDPMRVMHRDGQEMSITNYPRVDDYRYLTSLKLLVYTYQKLCPMIATQARHLIVEWVGPSAGLAWARWIGFPGLVSLGHHAIAEYWRWCKEPTMRRIYVSAARFGCMMAATVAVSKFRQRLGASYGIVCLLAPEVGFFLPAVMMQKIPVLQTFLKKYLQ